MTTLNEKIAALPPELQLEVEAFIGFLLEKRLKQIPASTDEANHWQTVSQVALDAVWDNDEDDVYAELLKD